MKVYFSPEALTDLQQVKESVIEKFNDVELANQILRTIMKSAKNLQIFPGMGMEVRISASDSMGYRYLFVKKNYVFYRIEQDTIRIVRVLNEKQDYMRILYGITEDEDDSGWV